MYRVVDILTHLFHHYIPVRFQHCLLLVFFHLLSMMPPAAVVSDTVLPSIVPESEQTPANASHSTIFSLSNKTIAITGGGRGLGITLAAAVLEAGGHAACLDILEKPSAVEWAALQKTAKLTGLHISYHQCDITNEEQLSRVLDEIAVEGMRLQAPFYGAIACAGIQQKIPAVDYPAADFERILRVNVLGTFLTAKHSARILIESGVKGSVVMIASMSGQIANRVSGAAFSGRSMLTNIFVGTHLHRVQYQQIRSPANVSVCGTGMGPLRYKGEYLVTGIYQDSDDE